MPVGRSLVVHDRVYMVLKGPRHFADTVDLFGAWRMNVHRDFAVVIGSHFSFSLLLFESILNVRPDSYAALLPVNAAYSA